MLHNDTAVLRRAMASKIANDAMIMNDLSAMLMTLSEGIDENNDKSAEPLFIEELNRINEFAIEMEEDIRVFKKLTKVFGDE